MPSIDEVARRVRQDRIRELAAQDPSMQGLLDQLDAMYLERSEIPPATWVAPPALQHAIALYVAYGADPHEARTHFYRQWLVGETPRGRAIATALGRGIDGAERREGSI